MIVWWEVSVKGWTECISERRRETLTLETNTNQEVQIDLTLQPTIKLIAEGAIEEMTREVNYFIYVANNV